MEIVGGSALEIYLSSADYVSHAVDLVGRKDRIAPVLRRWKFQQVEGRSPRVYWFKEAIGLIDIVGAGNRSGLRPRVVQTPIGPVRVSAVEPLVVRCLVGAQREKSVELYGQALKLVRLGNLDWDYLEALTRYEGVASLWKKLRKTVQK